MNPPRLTVLYVSVSFRTVIASMPASDLWSLLSTDHHSHSRHCILRLREVRKLAQSHTALSTRAGMTPELSELWVKKAESTLF